MYIVEKKNKIEDLKCKKCNKGLDPKENMFLEYLKDHIKDDLKGKTEDKIFDIIKNFIISHLCGSIFTATLIFTIVSAIVTNVDSITKVTEKPSILVSNLNECIFSNSLNSIEMCDEGYKLEEGKCKKEVEIKKYAKDDDIILETKEKEYYTLTSNYSNNKKEIIKFYVLKY